MRDDPAFALPTAPSALSTAAIRATGVELRSRRRSRPATTSVNRGPVLAACGAMLLLAASGRAQQRRLDTGVLVRADPGVVIDGRVATTIHTTMRVPGSYGRPVPRVPLLVIDSRGQRTELATDDAGTLTVMLAPGPYRIVTTQPVRWEGLQYEWDVAVTVGEGVPILDLNQANSTRTVAAPSGRPGSQIAAGVEP